MPDPRSWRHEVRARLADLNVDPARQASIVEEVGQHLEERHRTLTASGATDVESDRAVMDELRDADLLRWRVEQIERRPPRQHVVAGGSAGSAGWFDAVWQDVRYGARTLMRSPGFTAVAAITLALGVGANTAIFAVFNTVVLRPLPFADTSRLVRIWESNPAKGWTTFSTSQPNFVDFRARASSFEYLAAAANVGFTLADGDAEAVRASAVSVDFLRVLGITPEIGRQFTVEEDRPGANARVALVTHGFWQRRFNGSATGLGQTLILDNQPYEVIGVLPQSFALGNLQIDLMVPLAADPTRRRGDRRLAVIGRLKPGVSIDQAQGELELVAAQLAQQFPATNDGWSVVMRSFYDWLVPVETRNSLSVMMGAVGLVLLIATGNAANLLLARASARQREFSVRAALGAKRSRIIRQWLIESLLIGALAAGLAVVFAWLTTRVVASAAAAALPRLNQLSMDATVVAVGIALSLGAALLFGSLPAIQASRPDFGEGLKEGSRGSSGSRARERLRAALVVAEVALSVSLLIGAGLLIRSFWRVQQVDPGFRTDRMVTMRMTLPRTPYDTNDKSRQFYDRLLPAVSALAGVEAAATSSGVPLTSGNTSTALTIPGRSLPAGEEASASWRLISPGHFRALGIPLRGRDFEPGDSPAGRDPRPVTIISEEMARRYWPGEDALGKTVLVDSISEMPQTIIGIAGNVRSFGLDADAPPTVYFSTLTYAGWNPISLIVRSRVDPASHIPAIRAAVREIDPRVAVFDVQMMDDLLSTSLGARRLNMYLLSSFAAIALVLACVGLFGVLAYLVAQRTRDIGIRMALGASRRDVFRLILRHGLALASAGCVLGMAGGFLAGRLLRELLFSVGQADPVTFAVVPSALLAIALLACYAPARRAMRVDPLVALRAE